MSARSGASIILVVIPAKRQCQIPFKGGQGTDGLSVWRRPAYLDLRTFRVFFGCFAADVFDAPAIRKSSCFLPDLIAAANQRGFNPRPAQVSAGFSGLRYLAATDPLGPPLPTLPLPRPPSNRISLDISDSSSCRRSVTFAWMVASILSFRSRNFSIDILFRATCFLQSDEAMPTITFSPQLVSWQKEQDAWKGHGCKERRASKRKMIIASRRHTKEFSCLIACIVTFMRCWRAT
jgi:hypothetical protein